MSFWDIASTAASIYAGATLGPWAGAAVGGGINALRGEDVLGGAVSGYLGGMGGSDIAGAMDSTAAAAKAAGTNVGTINNAMLTNAGVLGPQATMTGFGGASGLGSLPGATSNIATNAGLQNVTNANRFGAFQPPGVTPTISPGNFGSVQGMKPGVDFANLSNTQPIADVPGGGGFTNTATSPFNTYADQSISGRGGMEQINTDFVDTYNPSINKGLQNTEVGANFKPNTTFKPGENYNFVDQKTVMPEGGFSWEDRFSAVSDNPGQFLDDLGGGGEYGKLIGGGKLALTGAGLVAPMFAEDYGVDEGYTSTFDDSRFRGPDGQLNLSGNTGLRLYAEGGDVGGGVTGAGLPSGTPVAGATAPALGSMSFSEMVSSGIHPANAAAMHGMDTSPYLDTSPGMTYYGSGSTPADSAGLGSLTGSTDADRMPAAPAPTYMGGSSLSEYIGPSGAGAAAGMYPTPSGPGITKRRYEEMMSAGYAKGGTVQPQDTVQPQGGGRLGLRALLNGSMQNMQTSGVPEGMTIADVMMASRGYNSTGEKLAGGGYLDGGMLPGDGMSDDIPAMIGNNQPAALSEGEFVIPADVVSHLGNGSSNAGSKQLYAMMDKVRKDRTGTEKQGNQIDPRRYMPA
ncbi:hypothetical protein N9F47_03955 [Gammaproteobacteria bacterium]|nr:hypothetical protein [Gammaproteobacteria bacterium]